MIAPEAQALHHLVAIGDCFILLGLLQVPGGDPLLALLHKLHHLRQLVRGEIGMEREPVSVEDVGGEEPLVILDGDRQVGRELAQDRQDRLPIEAALAGGAPLPGITRLGEVNDRVFRVGEVRVGAARRVSRVLGIADIGLSGRCRRYRVTSSMSGPAEHGRIPCVSNPAPVRGDRPTRIRPAESARCWGQRTGCS